MKSLLREDTRQGIRERIEALAPSARPLWGKMNAARMLAHCSAQLRMSWGEIPCKARKSPLGRPPIKQALVYFVPWPKSAPTAPELIRPDTENWQAEKTDLLALVDRFPTAIQKSSAPHPLFGKLSRRAWGRLAFRHLDHHLRQFGL